MSSFTPGPWHVGVRPGPIVYGRRGEQVADLRSDTMMPDEIRSNARLIAAAPELLEALRKAKTCMSIPDYVMDLIRAAIAKAEGR